MLLVALNGKRQQLVKVIGKKKNQLLVKFQIKFACHEM